jgi:hypothetical protein
MLLNARAWSRRAQSRIARAPRIRMATRVRLTRGASPKPRAGIVEAGADEPPRRRRGDRVRIDRELVVVIELRDAVRDAAAAHAHERARGAVEHAALLQTELLLQRAHGLLRPRVEHVVVVGRAGDERAPARVLLLQRWIGEVAVLRDPALQGGQVTVSARAQALARDQAGFDLGDVEPATMLGCVVHRVRSAPCNSSTGPRPALGPTYDATSILSSHMRRHSIAAQWPSQKQNAQRSSRSGSGPRATPSKIGRSEPSA